MQLRCWCHERRQSRHAAAISFTEAEAPAFRVDRKAIASCETISAPGDNMCGCGDRLCALQRCSCPPVTDTCQLGLAIRSVSSCVSQVVPCGAPCQQGTALQARATSSGYIIHEMPLSVTQAARCSSAPQQPRDQAQQHSRRAALAMGAAAGIVLPGMLRPDGAAAAVSPNAARQPGAQQALCRASAFDGGAGLASAARANPVADVAEGSIAARSNDRIELGKSGVLRVLQL